VPGKNLCSQHFFTKKFFSKNLVQAAPVLPRAACTENLFSPLWAIYRPVSSRTHSARAVPISSHVRFLTRHVNQKMPKRKAAGSDANKKTYKKKPRTTTMTTVMKPELKAFDISAGFSYFTNVATFELLCIPKKGTDRFERIGRKIRLKNVHVKGKIFPSSLVTTNILPEYLRYLIIWDKQPNGVPPVAADLLKDSTLAAVTNVYSFINLDNRDRFEILRDVSFPCAAVGLGPYENISPLDEIKPSFNIDQFIPLNGKEMVFNALSAGNAGDITSGALYVVTCCQDLANDSKWVMTYSSRTRYYDV